MLPIDRGGPAVEAAAALEKHGRRGFQSDRNLGGGDKKWWDTWIEGPVGFVDGLAVTRKWGGGGQGWCLCFWLNAWMVRVPIA